MKNLATAFALSMTLISITSSFALAESSTQKATPASTPSSTPAPASASKQAATSAPASGSKQTATPAPTSASAPAAPPASPAQQQDLTKSCKKFVQDFYTWYRFSNKPDSVTEDAVMTKKKYLLSPALYKALKEDEDAAAKSPGEIVGLDFDPFYNAQDYADKYVVGNVKQKGAVYLVDVWGLWEGKKRDKPDVVAEVQQVNGKWIFTNMHYGKTNIPENENLLSILRALKKERGQK